MNDRKRFLVIQALRGFESGQSLFAIGLNLLILGIGGGHESFLLCELIVIV